MARSLTRRIPMCDTPGIVNYHGPVNSMKLLTSCSVWSKNLAPLRAVLFSLDGRKLWFSFALVWHFYAKWLVSKTCVTFSVNQKLNQSWLAYTRFPVLRTSCRLHLLASSFDLFTVLSAPFVNGQTLVLRHPIENHSSDSNVGIQ